MPSKNVRRALGLVGVISLLSVAGWYNSESFKVAADALPDVQIANSPASEGRTITPAGKLLTDAATNQIATGSLTTDFVRSPDGRYLIAVNNGFGIQFSNKSRPQQTLSVIDLQAQPEPQVIQNVYFPAPSGAFGITFNQNPEPDGSYRIFVAGGFENKIWLLGFRPPEKQPIAPANAPDSSMTAPFLDVSAFANNLPSSSYNGNVAAVYPMSVAASPDGNDLYIANNLGDSLGIINDLRDTRKITKINLQRPNSTQFVYPYAVKVLPTSDGKSVAKIYVSLWGDGSIAVVSNDVNPKSQIRNPKLSHIQVDRHPTAMLFNKDKSRLFVVNSNADIVSVIETKSDKVAERINVKIAENAQLGASPEGLALSDDEKTLYVANAHANAVAVVSLNEGKSKLLGTIPTGQYASAVAVAGNRLFVANGKGTGVENSSTTVNNSGRNPNLPNEKFPATGSKRGAYNPALVVGNISLVNLPNERELFAYTQQTLRNNGLLGAAQTPLFPLGKSPFKHVIYIVRENRTYDQVLGDLPASGDGTKADGDTSGTIFGNGEAAKSPTGKAQKITPNAHNIALRFGLLDRFFVNAEASPDGHNWSTAAFSNDYIDKAFRWNYSGRGRTYDFEGFNRLPSYDPPANQPPVALPSVFKLPATENDVADYLKKYVPYLNGNRDVGEPESLYLWDAAQKADLTYRNYGEYVATVSTEDVKEVNTRIPKKYPDLSPTLTAFAVKKSLEGHFSPNHRNFDQSTPDSFTTESYRAAKENNQIEPAITRDNKDERFRGNSRFGEWQNEFRGFVADLNAGKGDKMPNLSIIRFSNDHTAGLRPGTPTPQFYVAENDYAVGKLVEEVSNSPYWKETAIFIVEDDAQDGGDHVDAHRSPGFVISAYNRKGALVHNFHNTVSLIRTMELCLGIAPMNLLDATATPIDIFQPSADLTPFKAELPDVELDNLMPPSRSANAEMRRYFELTAKQDFAHADMANPLELNEIIWYSVNRNRAAMPEIARLPAFDLMTAGLLQEDETEKLKENNENAELNDRDERKTIANQKEIEEK